MRQCYCAKLPGHHDQYCDNGIVSWITITIAIQDWLVTTEKMVVDRSMIIIDHFISILILTIILIVIRILHCHSHPHPYPVVRISIISISIINI